MPYGFRTSTQTAYTSNRPVATFQAYYRRLLSSVRNPSGLVTASASAVPSSPQQALQSIRNLSRAQVASAAVIAAECLGFFTVGEIIGRRKIIGYHGEPQSAHH